MSDYFDKAYGCDITRPMESTSYGVVDGQGLISTEQRAKAAAHAINNHDKLVEALQAAMDYIKQCPCDPDIYPEQLEAWNKLKSLNPEAVLNEQ